MERVGIEMSGPTDGHFRVSLQAGKLGSCEMNPEALSVQLAQHVLRSNVREMWNSISIFCEEEPSGALVVRVMVFNPDWEAGLQIAELRSWPQDGSNLTPLGCNLDHVGPPPL
jgi:hypothetical protein